MTTQKKTALTPRQDELLRGVLRRYVLPWVTIVAPTPEQRRMIDHPEPIYERRRAEDLRAGDILWLHHEEALITATDARESVATRDPILRLHYVTRYAISNTRFLRAGVVLARVRRPASLMGAPDIEGGDALQDELATSMDESDRRTFWHEVARQVLVDDPNMDDERAAVVWRNPRIPRVTPSVFDQRVVDETTEPDNDHDTDDDASQNG